MQFKSILIAISFFAITLTTFVACNKHESNTQVQACNDPLAALDSSSLHPKNLQYSKLINDLVSTGIPGISIVIEDDKGTWKKAIGLADIDNKVPLSICHNMKVASITKLFNATLVYKLIDDGKLNINDKISKYLDADLVSKLKNAEQCTIADLLQHSSGIFDFVFDPSYVLYSFNNLAKEKDYMELLKFAYNKEPAFAFGSKREYNFTVNYMLLAMIVEKVSGQSFAQAMRSKIFEPLSLSNTFMRPADNINWSNTAKGYFDYRRKGILQDLSSLFTGDGTGFTGIYTNPYDLQTFIKALYKDKSIISSKALATMQSTINPDDSVSYGVGCRIYGVPANGKIYHWYGHPGGEVNYASGTYYCAESNATVSYMLNYGDAFSGAYSDAYLLFRRQLLRTISE